MMDLSDAIRTLVAPLIAPETTITIASSDVAAAVNWASVDTVVVVPPVPPVVLSKVHSAVHPTQPGNSGKNVPAILARKPNITGVGDRSSLLHRPTVRR